MRSLAVEAPVNLIYGSVPHAVMMATPADLEDFAYGFSLTEGIVESGDEIRETRVEAAPDGLRLHVELAPGRLREHLARKRAISGRTGCGVCGIEDLAELPRAEMRDAPDVRVALPAIARALGGSMPLKSWVPRPGRFTPRPGPGSTARWSRCGRMSAGTMPWTS